VQERLSLTLIWNCNMNRFIKTDLHMLRLVVENGYAKYNDGLICFMLVIFYVCLFYLRTWRVVIRTGELSC
jgi:hypothetical protein